MASLMAIFLKKIRSDFEIQEEECLYLADVILFVIELIHYYQIFKVHLM